MRKRNLIAVTVLSIVTVGIYDIYWAFSTRDELVKKGHKVPTPWIVMAPLLSLIVIAIAQILVHLVLSGDASGLKTTVNVLSILIGVLSVIAIIPMGIYWVWQYSKAVGDVTKGELSAEVSMVVAIVTCVIGFGFIWPIVVQYYYNQLSAKS